MVDKVIWLLASSTVKYGPRRVPMQSTGSFEQRTLTTAFQRLQLAHGKASATPTSCRTRHCNARVKSTRLNAMDRLG